MVKMNTLHTVKPHTDKVKTTMPKLQASRIAKRGFGLVLLAMSASVFIQMIPLVYIFIGGLLGLPADAKLTSMDGAIWLLTCVTAMLIAVYGFIAWTKYVWGRFVNAPATKS